MTAVELVEALPEETVRRFAKVLEHLRAGRRGAAFVVLEYLSAEELDQFLELAEAMLREKPWRNGRAHRSAPT